HPDCGVVEDPGRRPVHVMAGGLPGLIVANDSAAVSTKRLDVRGSFEEIDRRAERVAIGSRLEGLREGHTERSGVALGVCPVCEAKPGLRVQGLLCESFL